MHRIEMASAAAEAQGLAEPHVPVSMCSPEFRTVDRAGFLVSEVWFAPNTVIPRHTHERPVLGVMLSGSFDDRFSSRTLEPVAGELFTEPAEEGHSNHVGSQGARVLVIQPDPSDEELMSGSRSLLDEIRSMRHGGVSLSALQLSREIRHADDVSGLAIESLALDMIVTAVRFGDTTGEPGWLQRVDEIVRDTFLTRWQIAHIAQEVGVHRAQLARAYKRHRGFSIGTHIRQLRLAWAAERLVESDETLSSIAIQAGFADQSHLTRQFKRRYAVPPGAYRAAHRIRTDP